MTNGMSDVDGGTPAATYQELDWRTRSAGPPPERQTMTITELARILGISRTTCYELAQRHELPVRVVRVGRRLLVSKVEVNRFLEGATTAVTATTLPPDSR